MGVFGTQNSYKSLPAMLGEILMVAGGASLINVFMIYLYIDLVAKHTQISALEGLEAALKTTFVDQTALVLSVPVSSLIWCFLTAFLALIFYIGQPGASQIDPGSYMDDRHIIRAIHQVHTNASSRPSTMNSSSSPQHVVSHTFSSAEKVCIGAMVIVCIVRFLCVLYSVLYLRTFEKHGDLIGMQNVGVISVAEGSTSSSHDHSEAEAA